MEAVLAWMGVPDYMMFESSTVKGDKEDIENRGTIK